MKIKGKLPKGISLKGKVLAVDPKCGTFEIRNPGGGFIARGQFEVVK